MVRLRKALGMRVDVEDRTTPPGAAAFDVPDPRSFEARRVQTTSSQRNMHFSSEECIFRTIFSLNI